MSFKLKAEIFLKDRIIKNAVISVPAYFNKNQRDIIKKSAEYAGFNVLRLINEPTAAALSYGLGKNITKDGGLNIIVFDFGGGTLDVSLLNINNGIYEVLGSCGNNNLGGSDFDVKIMEYCIEKFINENNISNDDFIKNQNNNSLQKLKYLSEQCKIVLSDNTSTKIKIFNFYNNINLEIKFDRELFNQITQDLISLLIKPLSDVLECCELTKNDIDEIIMVGGMTRIPIIRYTVERFFNKDVNCSIDPDSVVSIGASIHGYMLCSKSSIEDKIILIDRTSLSIGLETSGGIMDVIIPRGTIIPTKKIRKYTTDTDFVDSIDIKIYEGERKFTRDNFLIEDFSLSGIEKKKRGLPEIQITFEVDTDGIIKIKAEDLENPLNKKIIKVSGNKQNLSNDQIEELVNNAKIMDKNDRIDKMKKESYLSLIDSSKRILENINSENYKIEDEIKKHISNNIKEILDWLNTKNYEEIEVEKYKELLHDYKLNYSIYLLQNSLCINELQTSNEEDTSTIEIYDNENNKKYLEQIKYFRRIIDEYEDINKHLKIIKYMKHEDNMQEKIEVFLENIISIFNNTKEYANDTIILFFIDKQLSNDEVEDFCKNMHDMDSKFKEKYSEFNNEFDLLKKLFNKIKEKEDSLLEELEKMNTEDEIINNKLEVLLEFHSYIYKMNNGYITVENNKIMEIINILEEWK